MKKEGWDFAETLRHLAERAGVQLRAPTPQEQAAAEEHDNLRTILEEAVIFYRHQLTNTPKGNETLQYLVHQRGLSPKSIESFGLGYAPDSWDTTHNHFLNKGYTVEDLLDCGLVTERESSGVYDRFRNRVMFPIRDERGRMSGFGARIIDPDDVPKFLNSPQSEIFDKSRTLYGLDQARKAIRTMDQVVIVEGYLDVIALHQAGFKNSVSPMGTALTENHLRLLKRFSRRMVLALDPDSAGDKATIRGLQVARQSLDREQEPVFDARGLMHNEARLKADIRVAMLPDDLDPDELVNRDPQEWKMLVENARPIVIHVMHTLAENQDLDDPKVKTQIAEQVLPLIDDNPNPIERDTFRQRLARLLHVDERTLLEFQPVKSPVYRRRPLTDAETRRSTPTSRESISGYALEAHCLGVMLRQPERLYQIDRQLQEAGLSRISAKDFQHADHQAIMQVFQESINQSLGEPLNFVMNNLSLPMMEVADDLLERTSELSSNEDRILDDLMRGLLELRLRNLHQNIEYLRYMMDEAQEDGDIKATSYMQKMLQHTETLRRLNYAINRYTSRSSAPRRSSF